jgi:hypothetical protein
MRKLLSVLLAIVMTAALAVPALAAGYADAAPPAWVDAKEYVVFNGNHACTDEEWANVLKLRADAAAGHKEPVKGSELYDVWMSADESSAATTAYKFELGLIGIKYAANSTNHRESQQASKYLGSAYVKYRSDGSKSIHDFNIVDLWIYRSKLLYSKSSVTVKFDAVDLYKFLQSSGYTMKDFKSYSGMSAVTAAEWKAIDAAIYKYQNRVEVWLDGSYLKPRSYYNSKTGATFSEPEAAIVNNRTMVPIRWIAENLGADVEWTAATKTITMTRAATTVIMHLGSKTAAVNGRAVAMDVAPYAASDRTIIPARYVAEFFGQKVTWNAASRRVDIAEDKTVAGDSNLEAWALPMGAPTAVYGAHGTYNIFGSIRRTERCDYYDGEAGQNLKYAAMSCRDYCRQLLSDGWGINSRADLIETVNYMTVNGHNHDFLETVDYINSMTPEQYSQTVANASGADKYMFPYTKQLSQKWGSRGIIAWDLFRMSDLAQWGYAAGYVTYQEALALLQPAAELTAKNFKSWDEAYENYLDGYIWWARIDLAGRSDWDISRGKWYKHEITTENGKKVFDNSLFSAGVKGVPGLTAQQIVP